MFWKICTLILLPSTTAMAAAIDEVNYWRSQNGLPVFQEDDQLTKFAQAKAEWRAARLAKNGHQGPPVPAGCREGCGEATPDWGWLTCCQEDSGQYAGAGVAVGRDGERYMVLVVRGVRGTPARSIPRPVVPTAHLTPDAPLVGAAQR